MFGPNITIGYPASLSNVYLHISLHHVLTHIICHLCISASMKGTITVILCTFYCNVFSSVNETWGYLTAHIWLYWIRQSCFNTQVWVIVFITWSLLLCLFLQIVWYVLSYLWDFNLNFMTPLKMDLFLINSFSLHKTFNDGMESWGLLVDYHDAFIRYLDSTYRAQHIIVWIL